MCTVRSVAFVDVSLGDQTAARTATSLTLTRRLFFLPIFFVIIDTRVTSKMSVAFFVGDLNPYRCT